MPISKHPVIKKARSRFRQLSWHRLAFLSELKPVSRTFGFDRGRPIDRHYIENFLQERAADIRGTVLEIADREYTDRFGGSSVTRSEVLHAEPGNPSATIVGDLVTGKGIEECFFDCMILTQTFSFLYEPKTAISNCFRGLKPGGVLLATVPGISQISRYDMDRWGDYWRFTDASALKLFDEVFGIGNVQIETHGNVLVACAFLHGLAVHEMKPAELEFHDPDYQLVVCVRAVKAIP
ncbi:MAG TPA: methyltransferase domain-containing protein [Verrucomicrobiae bacterium]|jgi:SAM-dependent methyltransferase